MLPPPYAWEALPSEWVVNGYVRLCVAKVRARVRVRARVWVRVRVKVRLGQVG